MADDFIKASKEPANNGYGQNGYQGASSAVPGEKIATAGLLPKGNVPSGDWQTRDVGPRTVPAHPHHRNCNANPTTITGKLDRSK